MVIELVQGERRLKASLSYEGAKYVTVKESCECGCFDVHSLRSTVNDRGTVKGKALCVECEAGRGELVVRLDTIFGLEEDDRVLNGRARVY